MRMSQETLSNPGPPAYNTFQAGEGTSEDELEMETPTDNQDPESSGRDNKRSRCHRLTAVYVLLLLVCVGLLVAIMVLSIKYISLTTENNLSTLTMERDRLQMEREELQRLSKQGWMYFDSSLYYISTEEKNWNNSRQDCKERGIDLVIINSKEEQTFLHNVLCGRRAWIGLDRQVEGQWTWVDGTPESVGYWGSGEPNNLEGNEYCVLTGEMPDPVYNGADYPCDYEFTWICEKTIFN
ncbi:C-type lectin domain family 4 member E-like [Clarias gariepinus]|uniref:C-type lectin domain family 4 member E-like n=1 Tax=Clarias gariepinus TaxID=13013 RepID=UPI00234C2F8B|nr:C-type lectin domain family 4 member E-like [Clarias gariepinus]